MTDDKPESHDVLIEAMERIAVDPLRYTRLNAFQERLVDSFRDLNPESITIIIATKGNGTGGSYGLVSCMSGIMFPTAHNRYQGQPWGKKWPFHKSLRLVTTTTSLEDTGPIQRAMQELWPAGQYQQSRGVGRGYYSEMHTNNGFNMDFMSYNQAIGEFAAHTKGAVFFSEPPPKGIFDENISRLRGRGLIVIEMTPLTGAAYLKDLIDAGGLFLDGRKVGEVRCVRGDIYDNCKDNHPGGRFSISSIEAQIAAWDPAEREARTRGDFMAMAGRIYPNWCEDNELECLPDYHQEKWDKGEVEISSIIDPHDRKPWMMGWFATFPNDDVVLVAEWPPFDFNACASSPVTQIEAYRGLIISTEAEIGEIKNRRIDPNFGAAIKSGEGQSIIAMLASACGECKKKGFDNTCVHRLYYRSAPDNIPNGHMLVRAAIGEHGKSRAKLYALKKTCPNFCMSMRRYAYKEYKTVERGLSERPSYVYKDGADLARYLLNSHLDKWPAEQEAVELWTPKMRGRRVSAT